MKCEKLACEKTKTIIIGVLVVLCVLLAILNITRGGTSSSSSRSGSLTSGIVNSGLSATDEKISPSAIIRKASIEGISLEDATAADVDTLVKDAGFSCEKSGDINQSITWNCKHNKLAETTLRVSATNGKLTEIYRNGSIDPDILASTMDMIDDLKFQLNTRENVRFSQSEDVYSLTVRTKTEAGDEAMDYSITNQRYRDGEGDSMELKTKQVYTAVLSMPAVVAPASPTPATSETTTPSQTIPATAAEITPPTPSANAEVPVVAPAEEKKEEPTKAIPEKKDEVEKKSIPTDKENLKEAPEASSKDEPKTEKEPKKDE